MYSEQAASKKDKRSRTIFSTARGAVEIGSGLGSCPPLLDTLPSS